MTHTRSAAAPAFLVCFARVLARSIANISLFPTHPVARDLLKSAALCIIGSEKKV